MWQVLTIGVLLILMLALQRFDSGLMVTTLDPKSLAGTGFIILAAFTTGELFKRFNIPSLLGYIAAGIVFGPNLMTLLYELGKEASNPNLQSWFLGEPHALFSGQVIKDLALINVLTVGVIGTMGGGELKLSDIKDSWRHIVLLITLITLMAIPLTLAVVIGLTYAPGNLVAFLVDQNMESKIAAGLLLSILAIAMSPAATLAILQESKARGKFTSFVLGVVVVADLALVALFLIGFSLAKLLVSPQGFSSSALIGALPGIGLEFAWALVIGGITGVVFLLYIHFVKREMMLFTVAIIFTTSYLCKVFHAETLLAFLTAGFIVQNISNKYGHALIHELQKISLPVFIIYFMTQAAQLDLKGVITYLPLTLILALVRVLAFYFSSRIVTHNMKANETTTSVLWMSFISRGGVDLVLAAMVAQAVTATGAPIFSWGTSFQTVIMSTVVVHIIAGPPLLKYALGRAGETEQGRQRSVDEDRDLDAIRGSKEMIADAKFPEPQFDDRFLNARILTLRGDLIDLHTEFIATPFDERHKKLVQSLGQTQTKIQDALFALQDLLERHKDFEHTKDLAHSIVKLHTQSRRTLQPHVQLWERLDPIAFTATQAQELIARVRMLEDFENHFIVEMEDRFYTRSKDEKRHIGLLRLLRRIQKPVAGRGRRNIPMGRLWRYYVELALPSYLAQAAVNAATPHEAFWHALGRHLRSMDQTFHFVLEALATDLSILPMTQDKQHNTHTHSDPDIHDEHNTHDEPQEHLEKKPLDLQELHNSVREKFASPNERALAFIQGARALYNEHTKTLTSLLDSSMKCSTQGYSWSLRQAFSAFIEATHKAGTLELPGFYYRPSTQFDQARRALTKLQERLQMESDMVSSYIGWLVLDHQAMIFSYWFKNYQQRISDTLSTLFREQCIEQLHRLEERCKNGSDLTIHEDLDPQTPEHEIAWLDWMKEELYPISRHARRALDRALISFGQGVASRRLIDTLESRITAFSKSLNVILQDPDKTSPNTNKQEVITLQVRQWFSTRLVNEIALRYIEFNERTERLVHRNLAALDSIDQVLEYNLVVAQRDSVQGEGEAVDRGNEVAVSALQRAHKMVSQLIEQLKQDVAQLEQWILGETEQLSQKAISPFMNHMFDDMHHQMLAHKRETLQQEHWASRGLENLFAYVRSAYNTITPLYQEVIEDVRHILSENSRIQKRTLVRTQLGVVSKPKTQELPSIYKRLFNPVPLDLIDFYVKRPELERTILEGIAAWGEGQGGAILLFGDRGIGKRTLIHNLVPIQIYDLSVNFQDTPIQTLRLSEESTNELLLCQNLAMLVPNHMPQNFKDFKQRVKAQGTRQIVVVENATKCFHRTSAGLKLYQDFLDMIGATNDHILWILLMDTPAALLLDTMTDLFDYFAYTFEVPVFETEHIEQMILNRHRVSGFDMSFEPPNLRLLYQIKHPWAASEATRNPRRDYFTKLGTISHGNPLLALLYWLRSIHVSDEDDSTLCITPIEDLELELTQGLTLIKKLILALLLQHSALTPDQLALMCQQPMDTIRTELHHLKRLGFIEIMVGTHHNYQLRDIAAPQVTYELRQHNLV